ncbi:HMA5 [Symbiodinium natans]|uniref:HMA5 protein n=1 Tax=Symbiodinium natans TaxID=878477 RepID=A0A812M0I8_9DINO|nr:HMA5 [Symbiodinium natans]
MALPDDAGFGAGLAPKLRRPQRNARADDKNNIYLVGHAAFGQGLTQLECYEFEDAATSLEAAWAVWKDVFLGAPTKPMPINAASSDEEDEEESESRSGSDSETDSSSDRLPERPRRIGANEAAAKAFFKAKSCGNQGAGVGATFAPGLGKTSSASGSESGARPRRRRLPRGFADDGESPPPPPDQDDRLGVWPPPPTVDIFAEALTDALVLRVTRATEEEALSCALEAQGELMATAGQDSDSDDDDDDDESEAEELSTAAYNRRAYRADVKLMGQREPSDGAQALKSSPSKDPTLQDSSGAKPQFHHYRRLMRGLCHCYVRLRRWVDLDRFIEEALPYFQEVRSLQKKKIPQFRTKDREELWITLQMQRAAACILIGRDHYEKADKFLTNVRRVQPKDRVLQRTIDSIAFLREQLKDSGAGDSAANEDALLTQAFLAMRWG